MPSHISRRHVLTLAATIGSGGVAGCLKTSPTLQAPKIGGSSVFKSVKASESWTTNQIAASIKLSSTATTKSNVRGLVITDSKGKVFWTGPVDASQTSVSAFFPTSGPAMLAATDYQGMFVEQITVNISARTLF